MKVTILILLAIGVSLRAEDGQSATSHDVPEQNAALQYWIAFALLPKETPIAWLEAFHDNATLVDDQAAQEHSPALQYLLLGASLPSGQFDSEVGSMAFGPKAQLPHVSAGGLLGRLAYVRCLWRLQHHQLRPAIEDALALEAFGSDLARHSGMIEGVSGFNQQRGALTRLGQCLVECSDADRDWIRDHISDTRHVLRSDGLFDGEIAVQQWNSTHPGETQARAKEELAKDPHASDDAHTMLVGYATASPEDVARWSVEIIKQIQAGVTMLDLSHDRYVIERERYVQMSEQQDSHNPISGNYRVLVLTLIKRYRANSAAAAMLVEASRRLNAHQSLTDMAGFQTLMGPVKVLDPSVGNTKLGIDSENTDSKVGMSIRIGHAPWVKAAQGP